MPDNAQLEDLVEVFGLSFDEIVPGSLVHKSHEENILVTDVQCCGEDWYLCGGRVPRDHDFFNETGREPFSDILFYTELGRQASIAVTHSFFNVPEDHCFILVASETNLLEQSWNPKVDAKSPFIAVEIKVKDKEYRRNGDLSKATAEYALYSDDCQVVSGEGEWSLQPEALYERIRRAALKEVRSTDNGGPQGLRVDPSSLGRIKRENVVISEPSVGSNGEGWSTALLLDPEHPFFFDHPRDHIPGILILEGGAQLALLAAAHAVSCDASQVVLCGCSLRFLNFVEFKSPVKIEAQVKEVKRDRHGVLRAEMKVRYLQGDRVLSEATMRAAFPGVAGDPPS